MTYVPKPDFQLRRELGAFTWSKTSMSGQVGVGGFEEGEFEGDGPMASHSSSPPGIDFVVAASLLPVVRIWHSALQRFTNNCLFPNRVPWRCSVHRLLDARGFPPKAETAAGKLNSQHAEARS